MQETSDWETSRSGWNETGQLAQDHHHPTLVGAFGNSRSCQEQSFDHFVRNPRAACVRKGPLRASHPAARRGYSPASAWADSRELLREQLESANYPLRDIEVLEREGGGAELVATLMGTSADPHELDGIVSRLDGNPIVENASWNLRTTE